MQNPKSFAAKWNRLMEASGAKNDSALARALGILPQSVNAARKRGQIPTGWVEKISEQFDANANWLFFGKGSVYGRDSASVIPDGSKGSGHPGVPVMGLASCGLAGWYNPGPLAIRMPLPAGSQSEGMFAVLAVGTSMQPEGIKQGHVLFCDPSSPPDEGDAVFIEKADGTVSVKQFKGREGSWIHLQGWLEPDAGGVQKPYIEKLSEETVAVMASVVYVKRKA